MLELHVCIHGYGYGYAMHTMHYYPSLAAFVSPNPYFTRFHKTFLLLIIYIYYFYLYCITLQTPKLLTKNMTKINVNIISFHLGNVIDKTFSILLKSQLDNKKEIHVTTNTVHNSFHIFFSIFHNFRFHIQICNIFH